MRRIELSLLPVERIVFGPPNCSKNDAIASLLDVVAGALALDAAAKRRVLDLLVAREKSGSTAGGSVAIPHVKSPDVERTAAALGVYPQGIDFDSVDGERVHAVFLLASPAAKAAEHLTTLRWIASIARQPDFIRFLRRTKQPEEVRGLLEELGG